MRLRATPAGFRAQVKPLVGEIDALSPTLPVNPLSPETVIVVLPVAPVVTAMLEGFALIVKSWIKYPTWTE